jgi:hypothetical protein
MSEAHEEEHEGAKRVAEEAHRGDDDDELDGMASKLEAEVEAQTKEMNPGLRGEAVEENLYSVEAGGEEPEEELSASARQPPPATADARYKDFFSFRKDGEQAAGSDDVEEMEYSLLLHDRSQVDQEFLDLIQDDDAYEQRKSNVYFNLTKPAKEQLYSRAEYQDLTQVRRDPAGYSYFIFAYIYMHISVCVLIHVLIYSPKIIPAERRAGLHQAVQQL